MNQNPKKSLMKVEIWSDVVCPFCYIGKRKFEMALAKFEYKDNIEIEWKSFQLNPDLKTDTNKKTAEALSESKGISVDQANGMINNVVGVAKQVGLDYNFDISKVANTFMAHRFAHIAKSYGKQDEVEEALFKAYFCEGVNLDDLESLLNIGDNIGLPRAEVKVRLESQEADEAVLNDIYEAKQIGVQGVPFFVFDRKYAVSGAQDPQVFLDTLQSAYEEMEEKG
jgi:predicted DsbA family dithiol-disulfide isomerase